MISYFQQRRAVTGNNLAQQFGSKMGKTKNCSFILFLSILFFAKIETSLAVPACPVSFKVKQPNGEELEVKLKGDEMAHWLVDSDGFTVVKNDVEEYVYATKSEDRELTPTVHLAGQSDHIKNDLVKGIRPKKSSDWHFQQSNHRQLVSITEGTVKNLVIPFVFSDHVDRALPSVDDLDQLFNSPGGHPTWSNSANMSVKEYFQINSHGKLTLESDVVDWIYLNRTEANVTKGVSGINSVDALVNLGHALHEVLEAADKLVDFSDYDEDGDGYIDSIAILHSGNGAEWGGSDLYNTFYDWRLWSHKHVLFDECVIDGQLTYCYADFVSEEGISVSNYHIESALYEKDTTDITTIAIIVHETLHFFNLPDLYDRDFSGQGIGCWGIMSYTYGWDNDAKYPPYMCAWSKFELSWVEPVTLGIGDDGVYEVSGEVETDSVYLIEDNFPNGEYLLIENRQPIGLEIGMPQGGLVIYHVASDVMGDTISDGLWNDEEGYEGQNNWPENGKHYAVAVVQADGLFNLEKGNNTGDSGDVFHASGVDQLVNQDEHPNTFSYQDGNVIDTGIKITSISQSDLVMSFEIEVNITSEDSEDSEDTEDRLSGCTRTVGLVGNIVLFSAFLLSFQPFFHFE